MAVVITDDTGKHVPQSRPLRDVLCCGAVLNHFSRVRLFATLWTVARQAPLSMGFSRQDYWSGLQCPPPGESSQPKDRTYVYCSSCLVGGFFTDEPWRETLRDIR